MEAASGGGPAVLGGRGRAREVQWEAVEWIWGLARAEEGRRWGRGMEGRRPSEHGPR